jgi:hypothetical protein
MDQFFSLGKFWCWKGFLVGRWELKVIVLVFLLGFEGVKGF